MTRFLCALCLLVVAGCVVEPTTVRDMQPALDRSTLGMRPAPATTEAIPPTWVRYSLTSDFDEVIVNLPMEARQRNWRGANGSGSCVIASMIPLARWQGRDDVADRLRAELGGGHSAGQLARELDQMGVKHAYTTSGDVEFLRWAIRTRRGCVVTWHPSHACTLVHLDDRVAKILNNNSVESLEVVPAEQFIRQWRGSYGGWAHVPLVGAPAAPVPRG